MSGRHPWSKPANFTAGWEVHMTLRGADGSVIGTVRSVARRGETARGFQWEVLPLHPEHLHEPVPRFHDAIREVEKRANCVILHDPNAPPRQVA